MQPIDDLFDQLPEPERELALVLRDIVRTAYPHLREKLAYGAPFYYGHRWVCYIWPAALPGGGVKQGVVLGFCRGYLLPSAGLLAFDGRKQVGLLGYRSVDEIESEPLLTLLSEAVALDQQ